MMAVYDHQVAYYAITHVSYATGCAPLTSYLEDGTVFSGRTRRRARRRRRRGVLHDRDGGLRGGGHRPELRGAGALLRYPLIGNYGVDAARHESGACSGRGRRRAPRRGPPSRRWLAEQGDRSRSTTSTRARSSGAIRDRGRAALRARRGRRRTSCSSGRSPSRRSTGRSRLRRRRRVGDAASRTTVGAGPRVTLVDLGCKRSIIRRLARHGLEVHVVPGDWDADAILATRSARRARRQRARATRPCSTADRDGARPARPRAALRRSASATRCSASRSGLETFKLLSVIAAPTIPCAICATGRVLVTVQNHGYAVSAADAELVTPRVPERRHASRAWPVRTSLSVQFHPEAAPGPLDALPFFDRIADACRSAPTFARS